MWSQHPLRTNRDALAMSALLWWSEWDGRWGQFSLRECKVQGNIFSSGFFYEDFVLVPQKSRISYILNFAFRSIFCILIIEHQEQIAAGEIYSEQLLDSPKQRNP